MITRLLALSLLTFAPVLAQEVELEIVEDHPAVADVLVVQEARFDDMHKRMLKELDRALEEAGLDKATRKRILKRMHAKAVEAKPAVRMKKSGKKVGKVEARERAAHGVDPHGRPARGMAFGFGGPTVKRVERKVHQHRGPDFLIQWHGDDMPPEARRHLEEFQRIMREHRQRKVREKARRERERAERARHEVEGREHARRAAEHRAHEHREHRHGPGDMAERVERLERRLDRIEHLLDRLADKPRR